MSIIIGAGLYLRLRYDSDMPTIQINLSDEEYRRLDELSRVRGLSVETWLHESLKSFLGASDTGQQAQRFLEWVERYADDRTPPIPLESLRREHLYNEGRP